MRSQDTFMQALFKVGRVILVCIFNAVALGQTANAQASMPEGTIGWYFYGPGSGNYAPDAVTACQLTATNHMGTQLKEMHPHPVIVWYDCKYPHFIAAGGEGWYGATFLECAAGYVPRWPGICTKVVEKPLPPKCMASDAGHARNNPVIISTGAKVQVEVDPIGLVLSPLSIERTYRTFGEPGGSLGVGWSFSFDRTLEPTSHSPGQAPAQVSGMWDHGSYFFFERDHVNAAYKPTSQSYGTLAAANALFDEWIYKNPAGRIDYFKKINGVYKLVSSHTKEGVGQFFTYDANARLQSISDSFGRELQVIWKNVYVIESIVGPELSLHYEYELADNPSGTPVVGTERLHKVLIKDANGAVLTTREYHYEDPNSRFFLTGITDENSNRYATYAYNQNGQVVSSEHAGGTDRNIYSYSGDTGRTITDPLGTARTFSLINLGGYGRVTSIAQPGGSGCGPGANSFTYDENRNVSSSTDFNGNKTCFAFDASRSLETGRIEGVAAGAACPSIASTSLAGAQRKILTQWHPDVRAQVKISAPQKRTSFIYNGQLDLNGQVLTCAPTTVLPDTKPIAVVCKRIEQATNDSNGAAGFNSTPVGQPRIWTFTYNALGQMLTSSGPVGASGNAEQSTFSYFTDTTATHTVGDLKSVANAKGHLTEYLEYNKAGKVTQMRDPNGVVKVYAYDPLSRLTSRTVGAGTSSARTTTFDYDGVGQIVRETAPDGSFIAYTYDAAQRLTGISDGMGNTIHYTLDNAGNRIREEVKDASGNLTRQVMRVFDPLNRLQEVTGAAQ